MISRSQGASAHAHLTYSLEWTVQYNGFYSNHRASNELFSELTRSSAFSECCARHWCVVCVLRSNSALDCVKLYPLREDDTQNTAKKQWNMNNISLLGSNALNAYHFAYIVCWVCRIDTAFRWSFRQYLRHLCCRMVDMVALASTSTLCNLTILARARRAVLRLIIWHSQKVCEKGMRRMRDSWWASVWIHSSSAQTLIVAEKQIFF